MSTESAAKESMVHAPATVVRPAFHHVNLKTTMSGLQRMIDWYGIVVGAEVSFQYPYGAWLHNDPANHRIALLAFPQFVDDPDRELKVGLQHVAFEFERFDDLMDSYARLRDVGITPFMCFDHGMTTSIYYHDPDANDVELQVDNFGDWAASLRWMRESPDFHENPLGVFFDPERLLAARAEGLSFAEIHRRSYAGEYLPDPLPEIAHP